MRVSWDSIIEKVSMDNYLLLKLLHILSAVVVTGTGAGIAFFMLMAYKSNNVEAIRVTAKIVILGDWIFTTPAIITLLATGILLMNRLGYAFDSSWFQLVIGLFVFIGCCWIPVLFIQYRLRDLSEKSLISENLNPEFGKLMRVWILLGILAFSAIVLTFWLMVFKPLPLV